MKISTIKLHIQQKIQNKYNTDIKIFYSSITETDSSLVLVKNKYTYEIIITNRGQQRIDIHTYKNNVLVNTENWVTFSDIEEEVFI